MNNCTKLFSEGKFISKLLELRARNLKRSHNNDKKKKNKICKYY